uniref:Putative radical SAM superfamily protein n=1 Tax=viral metagenome TaxID=1070528 RepID=A0A6M3INU1_9ZZZZ
MYLSSALKAKGHDVKVLNYNLWDYDLESELEKAEVAMFTGFEEFLPYIKRDAAICKELGIKTILGGALATFKPQEMLNYVDTVVVGEAEEVIENALTSLGIVPGHKPNLEVLPLPDYEGFGIDEYHIRHSRRYMGILTSRGCPYKCTFCAQTCKFKMRKLDSVFKEIDFYKDKYGIESICFNDNTLNLNKNRFLDICKGMYVSGISWGAAIRADHFDEQMAFYAKWSGCFYLVVGVESFKQDKLDRMNKRIKVDQIYKTLDLLHKFDIDYHGNVLVGFEDETEEDIQEELAGIPKHYKVFPVMVQPFIGTKDGRKRGIPEKIYSNLTSKFKEYIESKGKYCYPELVQA